MQVRLIASLVVHGLILPLLGSAQADESRSRWLQSIDIFTTASQPVERLERFHAELPEATVRIHLLDGIERFEHDLSQALSGDPEQARRNVLWRIQRLSNETRDQLRQSAEALAFALQLGVDRYPAIVFNGKQVVYGVTDLSEAAAHYRSWHRKAEP